MLLFSVVLCLLLLSCQCLAGHYHGSPTMAPTQSASYCASFVRAVNSTDTDACKSCLSMGCMWCSSGSGSCSNGVSYCGGTEYSGSSSACDFNLTTLLIVIIVLVIVLPALCICGCCCFACWKGWCTSFNRTRGYFFRSQPPQPSQPYIQQQVRPPPVVVYATSAAIPSAPMCTGVVVEGAPASAPQYIPNAYNYSSAPSFVQGSPQIPVAYASAFDTDIEQSKAN